MKNLPKISVITPSYNQGSFIKQTINSVLSQNYPNLEYWIIDGGSTDQTVKILKSFGKKINWLSEKDSGQTDAINKGMKLATGEVVCYLNSDDIFLPGTLLKVGLYFKKDSNLVWLTGDYMIIDANGSNIQSFVVSYKRLLRNLRQKWLLHIANYIVQPSTFWRRSVFKKTNYFDTSLRYCMDYDFWFKLMKITAPVLVSEKLSAFRIHTQSKGGSQYEAQFAEESAVMKRYTSSILLSALHSLHSAVTVLAYRILK